MQPASFTPASQRPSYAALSLIEVGFENI